MLVPEDCRFRVDLVIERALAEQAVLAQREVHVPSDRDAHKVHPRSIA